MNGLETELFARIKGQDHVIPVSPIVTLLHDPELRDNPPASEISGEGVTSRDMPHTHQRHLCNRIIRTS
jgi:hypothetical protein